MWAGMFRGSRPREGPAEATATISPYRLRRGPPAPQWVVCAMNGERLKPSSPPTARMIGGGARGQRRRLSPQDWAAEGSGRGAGA